MARILYVCGRSAPSIYDSELLVYFRSSLTDTIEFMGSGDITAQQISENDLIFISPNTDFLDVNNILSWTRELGKPLVCVYFVYAFSDYFLREVDSAHYSVTPEDYDFLMFMQLDPEILANPEQQDIVLGLKDTPLSAGYLPGYFRADGNLFYYYDNSIPTLQGLVFNFVKATHSDFSLSSPYGLYGPVNSEFHLAQGFDGHVLDGTGEQLGNRAVLLAETYKPEYVPSVSRKSMFLNSIKWALASASTGSGTDCGPCDTGVCGIGDLSTIPKPGDPDLNSSILSAIPGFMGIALSWTYPDYLPHAVSHTVIYRSTQPTWDSALFLARASGGYHFDRAALVEGQRYYYWIRIVSVNGTVGDAIGPASAVMQPADEQLIAILEGRINDILLDSGLRDKIDKITDLSSGLSDLEQNLLFGDNILTQLFNQLAGDLADVDTVIGQESIERQTQYEAIVASIDVILAKYQENAAAINQERVVRATADSAIAQQMTTVQTTVAGHTSSIQQTFQAIDGIKATYTLHVDADGRTGGLVLTGDASDPNAPKISTVFLSDLFAVALPGEEEVYPFIIGEVNGETVIALNARALIPDASIKNAMISGAIQSNDFIPGENGQGWRIDKEGDGTFFNIFARGNIEASSLRAGVAMVDTLNIAGQSIIITEVYTATGNVNLDVRREGSGTPSWSTIAIKTIRMDNATSDSSVTVGASFSYGMTFTGEDTYIKPRIECRLRRDSTVVKSWNFPQEQKYTGNSDNGPLNLILSYVGNLPLLYADFPGEGSSTYTLEARVLYSSGYAATSSAIISERYMQLGGGKR